MAIRISHDTRRRLTASAQRYFREQMDEDVGELKADLLIDFCLKEIGPTVYNQAIADAQAFFQDKVADLEGVCHELEFGYWSDSGKPR